MARKGNREIGQSGHRRESCVKSFVKSSVGAKAIDDQVHPVDLQGDPCIGRHDSIPPFAQKRKVNFPPKIVGAQQPVVGCCAPWLVAVLEKV